MSLCADQVSYEVRTEVVGEKGSAVIGQDQRMQVKSTDGRWGGQLSHGFIERFGAAYETELQCWVDAAKDVSIDGPGAWDGFAAVAVCEAGVQALHSGEKVPVRLDGETNRLHPSARQVVFDADEPKPRRSGSDWRPPVKLALDPQMFYSSHPVFELPDIAASLGYDWMVVSSKADFIPFFRYPRG